MQLFQDLLDQSKQLNRAPFLNQPSVVCHPPNARFKTVLFSLKIPNLPAPLHYFNFFSVLGLPNSLLLLNQTAVQGSALQSATVCVSSSPHMVGQLSSYSMTQQCQLTENNLNFNDKEHIIGSLPNLRFIREDAELSADLQMNSFGPLIYFARLRCALAEHWSFAATCQGSIMYKSQKYQIEALASFEFARCVNFPYIPFAFYVYQLINLDEHLQMILMQYRDAYDHVLHSRIYLRDLDQSKVQFFDQQVQFNVERVYPVIKTPNGDSMYLLREFHWQYADKDQQIRVQGQCRGDFKFGLGTGFVGSFFYQVTFNQQQYCGEAGYCEYIDCRALKWQEQNKPEQILNNLDNSVPLILKK